MKDRGMMKWGAFIMPEHVRMIKHWYQEDRHEEKRLLTEEQHEEINDALVSAFMNGQEIELQYYHEQNKYYETVTCFVTKLDAIGQIIKIKHVKTNEEQSIAFMAIGDVLIK